MEGKSIWSQSGLDSSDFSKRKKKHLADKTLQERGKKNRACGAFIYLNLLFFFFFTAIKVTSQQEEGFLEETV